jgi:hypothetical protein
MVLHAGRSSLLLAVAAALGVGCGGSVAPVSSGGQDGGGADGGGFEAGGQDAPAANDAPSVQDSPVVVDDSPTGPCQVDGVPCISASQCCTNACTDDACGNGGTTTCLADGTACTSAAQCCSNACAGTCGATPPPTCPVGANAGACEVCVFDDCCSDVVACEQATQCEQSEACFQDCVLMTGDGAKCAEECLQEYPSSTAETLFECAASDCASSCE